MLVDVTDQIRELLWNITTISADIWYTDALEFYNAVKEAPRVAANKSIMQTANMPSVKIEALCNADLIVFAYPVYVLRAPGQIKSLLDHFGVHWMVHRPKEEMFSKRAVILTQSIGAPNGYAQNDVATSLSWLGISDIKKLGFGLMEHVIWEKLSERRKKIIETKIIKFAKKCGNKYNVHKSIKHYRVRKPLKTEVFRGSLYIIFHL